MEKTQLCNPLSNDVDMAFRPSRKWRFKYKKSHQRQSSGLHPQVGLWHIWFHWDICLNYTLYPSLKHMLNRTKVEFKGQLQSSSFAHLTLHLWKSINVSALVVFDKLYRRYMSEYSYNICVSLWGSFHQMVPYVSK